MCSIYITDNKSDFFNLRDSCDSRGNFSYSVMYEKENSFHVEKSFNKINDLKESGIYIGHSQAPTNGMIKDINRIHPCDKNNSYLYHNGILKKSFIEKYSDEKWDTKVLFDLLEKYNFSILSDIDGSFACIYIKENNIYIFRNKLCNLYYNGKNICSIKYDESYNIIPDGIVYNFKDFKLKETGFIFSTKNNPYKI